jgi:dienelactone hydrolase
MTSFRILPAALAAAVTLAASAAQAEMKTQWVEYSQGGMQLKAYLAYDDKTTAKRPAIFVVHDRAGMTPDTLEKTQMWARLGYVAFAADIFGYGQGVLPKEVADMQAQTDIYTKNHPLMRARTQAGYDTMLKQPLVDASKVALIGYCFGGAVGVEFGATGVPLTANVAIHGSFRERDADWATHIKGMYLILHGAEDMGYPFATTVSGVIADLRAAKVPFEFELYSGTGHGFSNPKGKDEERANAESIATTTRTLKQLFGT